MSGTSVIEVSRLSRRYRRIEAVSEVSFTVGRGEIFGLLGPDGAGKSTVMQILAGVLLPHGGQAVVAGIDVLRDPEKVKARIGYMPQGLGLNLYDDLTVDEHLQFFADLRGVSAAQYHENRDTLLEITRLAPAARRQARHLSGGMRQKLGLASALIHLPEILLLDEPTTGVDPLSRRDFWQIISTLSAERGTTLLVTTPYLDEAERCHRVALMSRGRLLAAGTPDELHAAAGDRSGGPVVLEDVFVSMMTPSETTGSGPWTQLAATPPEVLPPASTDDRSAETVIHVAGLVKRFGEFTAVDDVSFQVRRGEIFGFLGPNGAGKTTMIKMLTGILRPTRGRGVVAGYEVVRQASGIKRTIGYMSQRFSLYPDLTVGENLRLYARIYGLTGRRLRDREEAVTATTALEEWRAMLARDLPLGIRQRLALACALLHEPPILFLDEPTSGVDPLARRRFWALLTGLSRGQGVTILVSTHYMKEAEQCDRLALMHRGRLVAVGEPAALRREAEARRGGVLEVASPKFREAAAVLRPAHSDLTPLGRKIHVFSHRPADDRAGIAALLAGAGIGPVEVREVPMLMDDVFATFIEGGEERRAVA